ncbi:hypothetical protein MIC448_2520002 [Microbacterium sp. C448]|nr:hypothetical protein MIC448_2520002 [Microbacterium sp. C448]
MTARRTARSGIQKKLVDNPETPRLWRKDWLRLPVATASPHTARTTVASAPFRANA